MASQATNRLKLIDTVVTQFTRKTKGGTVKLQTPLTINIAKQFGWISDESSENEMGILWPWQPSSEAEGDFRPNSFQLISKESTQKHHAMTLSGVRIYRLVIVRREIKNKKSKGTILWLTYAVDFTDDQGGKKLEAYMQTVDKSTLQFSYEQQRPLVVPDQAQELTEEDEGNG